MVEYVTHLLICLHHLDTSSPVCWHWVVMILQKCLCVYECEQAWSALLHCGSYWCWTPPPLFFLSQSMTAKPKQILFDWMRDPDWVNSERSHFSRFFFGIFFKFIARPSEVGICEGEVRMEKEEEARKVSEVYNTDMVKPVFCPIPDRALDFRSLVHDNTRVRREDGPLLRVSRLCHCHIPSDNHINEKETLE